MKRIALTATLCATAVQGACLSGHPTLADEFAQTTVVVAQVQSARNVQDDPEDPEGISATLYTARVAERLHGAAAPLLELRSDNTSSRFPMESGQRYMLFVRQARNGTLYIDPCGHSGALPQARAALAEARRLSTAARTPP